MVAPTALVGRDRAEPGELGHTTTSTAIGFVRESLIASWPGFEVSLPPSGELKARDPRLAGGLTGRQVAVPSVAEEQDLARDQSWLLT